MTATDFDRLAWLAERRTGVGASDVPAIVGVSRWGSPFSVWSEKVGLVPLDDNDHTDAQQFGLDLEPVIGRWFHRRTGLYVRGEQTIVRHPAFRHHFATLDGMVFESPPHLPHVWPDEPDPDLAVGNFEAKSSAERWETLPDYVLTQVNWQMWVTNADRTWVGVMQFPMGRVRFDVFEVERDQDLIAEELVPQVERFWLDYVVTGRMPPIDDHPATAEAITAAWGGITTDPTPAVSFDAHADLVDRFRELRADKAKVKGDLDAVESQIKAVFAERHSSLSEGSIGGRTVVSWRSQGRTAVDGDAVRRDHGTSYDRHSTIRVLRPHTPKS